MNRTDSAARIAGVAAGIAGLLTFLVLHALWIVPIWFILPVGLLVAGGGGLAVGWAYAELWCGLPRRPWTALAVVGVIAVMLLPAVLLAELRAPLFTVTPAGARPAESTAMIVARFVGELLVTATLVGGLAGRWLGRTRRAAVATAVAGFIFALGPGHNIPFIGGTSGLGKELALMAAVIVVSALVLVEGHAWLVVQERRHGNSLLAYALVVNAAFGGLFNYALILLEKPAPILIVAQALASAFVAVAAGIAILRYRLWDIDVIIQRTLVYSALTLTLGLIYVGCILLSRTLVAPYTSGSELAIVASTLAIAALFNPLRRRIQNLIDRRFYRRKYDAAKVLAAFGATARDATDLERLTAEMLHVVDETMRPEFVGLWLREPATPSTRDSARPDVISPEARRVNGIL
jgi:hypothetical protein